MRFPRSTPGEAAELPGMPSPRGVLRSISRSVARNHPRGLVARARRRLLRRRETRSRARVRALAGGHLATRTRRDRHPSDRHQQPGRRALARLGPVSRIPVLSGTAADLEIPGSDARRWIRHELRLSPRAHRAAVGQRYQANRVRVVDDGHDMRARHGPEARASGLQQAAERPPRAESSPPARMLVQDRPAGAGDQLGPRQWPSPVVSAWFRRPAPSQSQVANTHESILCSSLHQGLG